MTPTNLQLGQFGETLAQNFLLKKGYKVIGRNFRCRYGEIDIIASKGNRYIFVEVKCRMGDRMGMPYEAVTKTKITKILQSAGLYVLQNNLKDYKLSVHVVSILLNQDKSVRKIEHFENVDL